MKIINLDAIKLETIYMVIESSADGGNTWAHTPLECRFISDGLVRWEQPQNDGLLYRARVYSTSKTLGQSG